MKRYIIYIIILLGWGTPHVLAQSATDSMAPPSQSEAIAQSVSDSVASSSQSEAMAQSTTDSVAPLHKSAIRRYIDNLIHGNVDKTRSQRFDLSFAVVPTYTREGGVGLGGAVTALYRLDRQDTVMQPSDFQLSGSAAVKGLYAVGLQGHNYFRGDRTSLTYVLKASRKTLDFWGINFQDCSQNEVSQYVRDQVKFDGIYKIKLINDIELGVGALVNYTNASKMLNPSYLIDERKSYFLSGISASLQYDTRDFVLNPRRGIYAMLKGTLLPRFMGTYDKTLMLTTAQFDYYHNLWPNAIMAYDIYAVMAGSSLPWTIRQELGEGACRMRGYYSGRYIDNNLITTQVEIRQHLGKRLGCAAWVGTGTVFPSWGQFRVKDLLPNYGLGLRVEVKHNVNLRIDYGFGRRTGGIVIEFAEAF